MSIMTGAATEASSPASRAQIAASAGGQGKSGVLAWYGLTVLMMTTLFALVIRQMMSLIGPSLQTSLHFSDLQIGMLQGLGMAVFACAASYPMGWLADRLGRRLILAVGVAIWSLATFFCAFQYSFAGLFAGTVGIAIGEAGLAPIIYALIPDMFTERQRNTANLVFYAGSLSGTGIGMALGGAMLEWLATAPSSLPAWLAGIDSWRIGLAVTALPGPLFFLMVVTMPLAKRSAHSSAAGYAGAANEAMNTFLPYARTHWRALVCVFGSIFAMAMAMTAGLVWFPLALPRAFGIDPATIGVGLGTAITVATLIGVFLPGLALKFGGRFGVSSPIRAAALFAGMAPLPAAFLPFVTSPLQAYTVAALQGAAGIACSALMPGILQDIAPAHLRSRVLSLLGIVNALALAGSPLAIGAISGLLTSPRGLLYAIALVSVPSLVVAAVLIWLARNPYAVTARAVGTRFQETQHDDAPRAG